MASLLSATARLMAMNDRVWLRHANPWSVWTRVATAPVLFTALWSHVWIGWWAFVPVAACAFWLWLNPRVFPVPATRSNWASKGTFGERVFLNRKTVPIPRHHETAGLLLSALSGLALLTSVVGFVLRDFWLAGLAFHLSAVFKIWFVDRMVWLYDDMRDADPAYRAWSDS